MPINRLQNLGKIGWVQPLDTFGSFLKIVNGWGFVGGEVILELYLHWELIKDAFRLG